MLKKIDHSKSHLQKVLEIFGSENSTQHENGWFDIQYSKVMDGQTRLELSLLHRAVFDVAKGSLNTLNFIRVIGSFTGAWELHFSVYEHFMVNFIVILAKEFENIDVNFPNYYRNLHSWLFRRPKTTSFIIEDPSNFNFSTVRPRGRLRFAYYIITIHKICLV